MRIGTGSARCQEWEVDMEKNKWIRCEDRLPELREEVLIYAIGKEDAFSPIIAISELYIFKLLPFSNGTLEWRDPWDYFSKNYEVTHWMPLPDAPEVENKEESK